MKAIFFECVALNQNSYQIFHQTSLLLVLLPLALLVLYIARRLDFCNQQESNKKD